MASRLSSGAIRYFGVILTALIGVLVSIGAYAAVAHWQGRVAEASFVDRARSYEQALNVHLSNAEGVLHTLKAYFESTAHPISADEYEAFSTGLRERSVGLRDTGWSPRVTRQDRATFEQNQQLAGNPGFQITERDATGKLVPALERDEYFPIVYSDPSLPNRIVMGFDVGSEKLRRQAIDTAVKTGRPTATPPITLVNKDRQREGFISFLPVYGSLPGNVAGTAPRGVEFAVFETGQMIEDILASRMHMTGVNVYFFDPDRQVNNRLIYWRSSSTGAVDQPVPAETSLLAGPHWIGSLDMDNRHWGAIFVPDEALDRGIGSWTAIETLGVGIIMTGMIALSLLLSIRRGVRLELLTRQKHAAAEASNAKSGFLAMMSHEIRTPMNAILGLAGSLLDDHLPPTQREVVEAIRDSGDDLLRILNDILDFSKLDANKMTFENAPFAPVALINGVLSIMTARAEAKALRIVADTDPLLPASLLGDAGRIRQVLINLVSNAIKFTSAGQVTLRTRCISSDASAAIVEWAVTDTGIGIAADRIGSLFSEFMQADNSIARRFGGTGLGLAISKRLVSQMDGTIEVESVPGQGTTFRVRLTLPIALQLWTERPRRADVIDAFQAAVKKSGRTPRVLFAEDNPTNQFVARQFLKGLDIQVDMVADGAEAVDAASSFAYDVICMDVQMPEMDGLQATRLIRARGEPLATIPIIALTANAFPEDVRACFDAGMNQFVAKPVNRETLVTALMTALFEDRKSAADKVLSGSIGV